MTITSDIRAEAELRSPTGLRDAAINAIMRETGCAKEWATATLEWIDQFVRTARGGGYSVMYPSPALMAERSYHIFDRIIPHGSTARPGSAHEAVELALLDLNRDEYAIAHNVTDDSRTYCTVTVCLSVLH